MALEAWFFLALTILRDISALPRRPIVVIPTGRA